MITHELVSYGGWERCLKLNSPEVELIVTLEVGPRVLRFGRPGGPNVFKDYPEQGGGTGETEWMIRGGHRLWVAPECDACYEPDNGAVAWESLAPDRFVFRRADDIKNGWSYALEIGISGGEVRVGHHLTALGHESVPRPAALWALTVMAAGGTAVIPQDPLGSHPQDLLPNRRVVLWPYTKVADPRFTWDGANIQIRQNATMGPVKIGLTHPRGWCAYHLGDLLFAKHAGFTAGETYPDMGVNFEAFTNEEMLELETLGPLYAFVAGETREHRETWRLLDVKGRPDWSVVPLEEWLQKQAPGD